MGYYNVMRSIGSTPVRATAIWLLMLFVAFLAAGLRTGLLEPWLGEQGGHVAGTLLVVGAFAIIIWMAVPWVVPDLAGGRLVRLGVLWTLATVAFEFGFGHYVMGHPWSRLLADYDVTAGRLWVLVLATMLLMPAVTGAVRRRAAAA